MNLQAYTAGRGYTVAQQLCNTVACITVVLDKQPHSYQGHMYI
jgi:hypothetical protein